MQPFINMIQADETQQPQRAKVIQIILTISELIFSFNKGHAYLSYMIFTES